MIDPDAMLQLKLEVPRQPATVVERPRLISALDAVMHVRLVLATAPAGFGKSTMLAQWRAALMRTGHCVAWLTLDDTDTNPRNLLVGLIHSVAAAGVDMSRLLAQADQTLGELTIESAMRGLIAGIADGGAPLVIILDDYHRAATPEIDALMTRVIALLPQDTRLVLGSRTRPRINVPTLLASGLAAEVSSDMMRFTEGEARLLLEGVPAPPEFAELLAQAEGWPVALQLARLLLLQQGSEPLPLARLTARGGHLSSFLADQVLRTLPDDVVDFLIETSILEKFNAEITDSVRQRSDSWRMIERLDPLQSLLTPLDADNIWFRYHHLFAEYLQGLLRQRRPGMVAELHLRASQAFEQSGLLTEAVRHARAAGDFERCSALVEAAGGWRLILFGGMAQLNQLLEFIPHAERLGRPRLLLAEAYLHLKLGHLEQARATFDLVGDELADGATGWRELDESGRDAVNVGMLIRVYEDNSIDLPFLESFHQLRATFPDADGLTRGVLDCAGAVGALCVGRFEEAESLARQAMAAMRSANSVLGLNYCYLHAGLASLYRGQVRTASAYLAQAQAMASENFGADSGLKAISDLLMSAVHFWSTGTVSLPAEELEQAFRHVCDYDGWFDVYSTGLDTRFQLARAVGDGPAMEAIIADGERLIAMRGFRRLAAIVDAQRLLFTLWTGEGDAGIAARLEQRYPPGCWRHAPENWRPYQDVGHALAHWHLGSAPEQARVIASDLVAIAAQLGTRPYEIRALLLRASIAMRLGDEQGAEEDIRRGLGLAVDDRIAQPFRAVPDLIPVLGRLRRRLWQEGQFPLEAAFLSEITEASATPARSTAQDAMHLSAREIEVMEQLAQGLTNKEIARALDMTEHTVKFHLKNIFVKLGVDRRARAISLFNEDRRAR
ncbi:LuxR C-terminal-related transcriptional regulator [Flavisphingomonas formosensis]|uniref:LuxR C-terminal-related transcriptional regulator n=1 Tax=Flavisphingomonas formosensis TaxID=861534 RepID=UPI0012F77B7E|nr:LuxR C-terminal-related transcriptional regulator [Sphingomonas formosensis]